MASKKNSQSRSSPGSTAGTLRPVEPSRADPVSVRVNAKAPKATVQTQFWLEVLAVRLARKLGSLQIAVIGLTILALVLTIGTMVESWYSSRIAQELVYRTWWFLGLLSVLWLNILCAALKKWPWKKHQTGFLITHLGLLIMVAGGIFNSIWGVDSFMVLVDSDQPHYHRRVAPQVGSKALDKDEATIIVTRMKGGKEENLRFDEFRPGSLPWRSDKYLERNVDGLLGLLDWLAHPLPREWRADLRNGAILEILGYYPHARTEPFSPAEPTDRKQFPAARISLTSPRAGAIPPRWLAYNQSNDQVSDIMGVAQLEFIGEDVALIDEFLRPPSRSELGERGQVVLRLDGHLLRLNVNQDVGRPPQPIGTTGWNASVVGYQAELNSSGQAVPAMPAAEIALTGPGGASSRWHVLARFGGMLFPVDGHNGAKPNGLQAFYHFSDTRWGQTQARAVLQFALGADGRLCYRSYNSSSGSFDFEKSGTVETGKQTDIWTGMEWKFKVDEFYPKAANRIHYSPENLRPGIENVPGVSPALRCKLTTEKASKEFWVGQTESGGTTVQVGDEMFRIGYVMRTQDLGFEVKLLRAEMGVDPGTGSAASYTSYVQLTDTKRKIEAQDRMITMNQPLDHNGYKLFQSSYELLTEMDPATKKPVSYSGFTVSHDPGLWLKYIGSSMLALGIAIMFYMRAYFFKPPGRKSGLALANGKSV